ncbi:C4b-binding protein alpha chain-like isoform X2 [Erythrolamprus reginae]|uniref:C4b-binding protein alpha chain-like isoform X2 n=1 Tax=Erythrolamprus reginae TaxID=121349 RepID=UPI00396CD515
MWAWLFLPALFWLPDVQGNCTSPVPPLNSTLKGDSLKESYPVGTNLTYHCITGYEYIPGINPSITCLNTSKWSEISSLCRAQCPTPVLPPYSLLREGSLETSYPVGTALRLKCIPGYEPISGKVPRMTCRDSSTWSDLPTLCQGRRCPVPRFDNGRIIDSVDLRLGEEITLGCDYGFRLIGDNTRRCVLSGGKVDWNRDVPFCERIPCARPPIIPNGRYDASPTDSYDAGWAVTYRCDADYTLIGNSTITCVVAKNGVDGEWNWPSPECKIVKCYRPNVSNGKVASVYQPTYTYQDKLSIECNSGYSLIGSSLIECDADSQWKQAGPWCCKNNCTSPVPPLHSTLKEGSLNESYPVGTVLTFKCITGYEYIPGSNPSITCLNTSTWSEISSLCRGKRCRAPIIENGEADADDDNDIRLGGNVTFSCKHGYRLIGEAMVKCILKEGKVDWNREFPVCQHIPCEHPETVPNGQFDRDPKDEYYVGSIVIYRCNSDFALIGNSTIRCVTTEDGQNGKWDLPAPECRIVKCDLPKVENGKIDNVAKPSYNYNEAISFKCNPGYSTVEKLHITCGANSSWVPAVPKCDKDNCTSPVPPPHSTLKEGSLNEGYPVGTVLTFDCITGYEYIPGSNPSITCLNTSTWSEISSLCRGKQCHAPIIENGTADADDDNDIRLGGSVTFSCNHGYRLVGEAMVKCILKEGKVDWNREFPFCQHIPCKPPNTIPNGQFDRDPKDEYYIGSIVIYRCNSDFSLIGDSTIKCITTEDGQNGKWDLPAPECRIVKCDLPNVENGKIENVAKPSYKYNEAISFKCNPGYSTVEKLHITCGANSLWVPAVPKCDKENTEKPNTSSTDYAGKTKIV